VKRCGVLVKIGKKVQQTSLDRGAAGDGVGFALLGIL
jgi:hypothetical protein